jgi:hypothetical protein
MKRTFTSIVIALYAVVMIGITTLVHFCCGTIESVDLFPVSSSQKKCCCGTVYQKNCCRTELHVIQIHDNQITAASTAPAAGDVQQPGLLQIPAPPQIDPHVIPIAASDGSPPGGPPIYILNCTMLV